MQHLARITAPGRRHLLLAAAAVLVGGLLVALGAAVAGARGQPAGGFSSTVVPARPDQQAAGPAAAPAGAGGVADAAPAGGAAAPAQAVPPGIVFPVGTCAAAPTVQFQGRGLAATGVAQVVPATPGAATVTLSVSVQEHGADAATVIDAVQGRVAAVEAALQGAGAGDVQVTSFSTYGSPQARQFTAYASVTAQIGADRAPAASRAVLQVAAVSYLSTSAGGLGQPDGAEVRSAVAAAAAQAREMAVATAQAAGVHLGSVQSLVSQPPAVCYGGGLPVRLVQVTVTYALA